MVVVWNRLSLRLSIRLMQRLCDNNRKRGGCGNHPEPLRHVGAPVLVLLIIVANDWLCTRNVEAPWYSDMSSAG